MLTRSRDLEGLHLPRFPLFHHFKRLAFLAFGKRKFTFGYSSHKFAALHRVLTTGGFRTLLEREGYGIGLDERIVEYPWLVSRLPAGPGDLLDAGSVLNYGYLLAIDRLRDKKVVISTLAPEPRCYCRRGVSYVYQDLRNSCFRDGFFSSVVCLSTLEHVGMDNTLLDYSSDLAHRQERTEDYLAMVQELRRVLQPGGSLYVSVPFGAYANHKWLQVFDAAMVDRLIECFAPSAWEEEIFQYGPAGWRSSSRSKAVNAGFYGFPSHRGKRDPAIAAQAVACLELVR